MIKAFTFAFLLSLPLGNVCLMPIPMAMAAEMPMSPVQCTHCAHIVKEQPSPISAGCAGHCLSERSDLAHTIVARSPLQFAAIALPPSPTIIGRSTGFGQSLTQANGPPGGSPLAGTVVLLE